MTIDFPDPDVAGAIHNSINNNNVQQVVYICMCILV